MKNIVDNMAAAGSALSYNDLILHILYGLSLEYNSIITYITGQVGVRKMNVNEAYVLLLTQDARIEQQTHMLVGTDVKQILKLILLTTQDIKEEICQKVKVLGALDIILAMEIIETLIMVATREVMEVLDLLLIVEMFMASIC